MQGTTSAIVINVGGKKFHTTKSTLNKSPFFEAMLRESSEGQVTPFIDRDPDAFKHILSLLRDPTYPFPKGLEHELKFYGMVWTPIKPKIQKKSNKYMLLSDFVKLSPEEQLQHDGPIQAVSMKKALVLKHVGYEILTCIPTLELCDNWYACGALKTKIEDLTEKCLVLKIAEDTEIFFQESAAGVTKISKNKFQEIIRMQNSHRYLVVPVVKKTDQQECVAIYFTPYHSLHQFQ